VKAEKEAKAEAKGEGKDKEKKEAPASTTKPLFVKYGLQHVTSLIENKKAKLVVIAHDVDPIELVVWMPSLCRKLDVPFCFVKGKARLGQLVNKKTASVVALTEVRKEDHNKLDQIVAHLRTHYLENVNDMKKWGGGILGIKAQAVIRKREKISAREAAKTMKR